MSSPQCPLIDRLIETLVAPPSNDGVCDRSPPNREGGASEASSTPGV